MKATAELKMLPVSVLKPAAYNPRKKLKPGDKEYEKIKNSITEFGFADPLVVNADMTIIGGHQRLTVAMELGWLLSLSGKTKIDILAIENNLF